MFKSKQRVRFGYDSKRNIKVQQYYMKKNQYKCSCFEIFHLNYKALSYLRSQATYFSLNKAVFFLLLLDFILRVGTANKQ